MDRRRKIFSIAFLLPALIFFVTLIIIPLLLSLYYSFVKWNGISQVKVFVGLKNYTRLFKDADYWNTVLNTLRLIAASLIFQVFLALIIAYMLSRITRGFKILRTIYFIPVVISPVAIGLMFYLFYNPNMGIFNKILSLLNLSSLQRQWLSDPNIVLTSVIVPQVWQYIGMYVTIFLAAIMGIPDDVIESARMDGASSIRIFFQIVIPLIKDIVQICIVLAITGSLKAFDHAWAITAGGPGTASSYMAILMYKSAFVNQNFGYATSISITMLLYGVILSALMKKIFSARKFNY